MKKITTSKVDSPRASQSVKKKLQQKEENRKRFTEKRKFQRTSDMWRIREKNTTSSSEITEKSQEKHEKIAHHQ